MSMKGMSFIDMTHTCGDRFRIPIAGRDLRAITFTCPQCGQTERFSAEHIRQIEAERDTRIRPVIGPNLRGD